MEKWWFLLFTLAVVLATTTTTATTAQQRNRNYELERQRIIDAIFKNSKYNSNIRPNIGENETTVEVSLYILHVEKLDDMEMETQFYFRQHWNDPRLKFTSDLINTLSLPNSNSIWTPDTFFPNELSGGFIHEFIKPNSLLRIEENGDVLLSVRFSGTFSCPMDYSYFPFDSQMCYLEIESYAYTSSDIDYDWRDEHSLDVDVTVSTPEFMFVNTSTKKVVATTSTGNYTRIIANLEFERASNWYVATIFVPCIMFAIISWFAILLPSKDFVPRIFITLATLLVNSSMMYFVNSNLPIINYTKCFDIFAGVNVIFLFCALLHVVIIHCISSCVSDDSAVSKTFLQKSFGCLATVLEVVCKILYPALYIIFQIAFWSVVSAN